MRTIATKLADEEYLKSGTWKCDESPNGAHFWIGDRHKFRCKYCYKTKNLLVETVVPKVESDKVEEIKQC